MPYGTATARRGGSSGEFVSHFTGVRMRIVGDGSFQMKFYSFDEIENQELIPFALTETSKLQPFRLANFKQQRALLEGKTTEIDEYFKINRIIIFAKELWADYPSSQNAVS